MRMWVWVDLTLIAICDLLQIRTERIGHWYSRLGTESDRGWDMVSLQSIHFFKRCHAVPWNGLTGELYVASYNSKFVENIILWCCGALWLQSVILYFAAWNSSTAWTSGVLLSHLFSWEARRHEQQDNVTAQLKLMQCGAMEQVQCEKHGWCRRLLPRRGVQNWVTIWFTLIALLDTWQALTVCV